MSAAAYPIIGTDEWPDCHRIVVFPHQGAGEAAERLSETDGFDPVLMRGTVGAQAGDYVLLPDEQAVKWDAAELEAARQAAKVELVPTTWRIDSGETAAFFVAVNGVVRGRWSGTAEKGSISWTGGDEVETGSFGDDDTDRLAAAVRAAIPPAQLSAIRAGLPASLVAVP
jgi:hypothetical protein